MHWPHDTLASLLRQGVCLAAFGLLSLAASAAPEVAAREVATSGAATPDAVLDPVMRLLAERQAAHAPAVLPAVAAPEMLQRVRERAADMVLTALNSVGVRYLRGGNSDEGGFDCSGFTRHVFNNSLGLLLPRRADDQAHAPGLVAVPREDLQPGDLVFFNTLKRTFSHVGIYIGDNRFVHAPRPGGAVRTEDMGYAYWKKRFTGARRAPMSAAAQPMAPELGIAAPTAR